MDNFEITADKEDLQSNPVAPLKAIQIETKRCTLCEKDIEIAKFRIHDAMCHRLNYKCAKCGLIVQKAERQRHDDELCGRPELNDSFTVETQQDQEKIGSDSASKPEEEKEQQEVEGIGAFNQGGASGLQASELEDANEREIQRLMQEDLKYLDSEFDEDQQNLMDESVPMGGTQWAGGVRPADQAKEQQLLGDDDADDMLDHQDYEGNVFNMADEFASSNRIRNLNINNSGFQQFNNKMMAGHNFINPSQPMKRSNYTQALRESRPVVPSKQPFIGRMGAMIDTQRVPQQPGDEIDDLKDFKAQSEIEALEEQMLNEIMEQSMKQK